jgi:hypothetical protein
MERVRMSHQTVDERRRQAWRGFPSTPPIEEPRAKARILVSSAP